MAIEEYRRKRDFTRTPEPKPGRRARGGSRFVVHRHEARNLHYDLRIETGGVLACWAVPRGFSYAPADKRLAVRVEDHPLMYTTFEGPIPEGQYGAGTMLIWDEGEYEVRKAPDIAHALQKGELKLELKGRRLRGEWHMVLTKSGKGNEWLLFKAKDRYAGSGSSLFGAADMSRAARKPMPRSITRMEASEGAKAFDDPAWAFEPLLAGKRVLVRLNGSEASIRSRDKDLTRSLAPVVKALSALRVSTAVLDGVLVVPDRSGTPSEDALEQAIEADGAGIVLYLVDALYAEEWDLRDLPLLERKALLRAIIPDGKRILGLDPVLEKGVAFAEAAAAAGFTSMVAKRVDSRYRGGESADWLIVPVKASPRRKARPAAELFEVSHPGKVYWPDQGYTKGELVGYYDRVSPYILPYLRDRPLHLYRWPDGIRGKSFYQKQLPPELLELMETVDVAKEGEESVLYAVCNDRKALLSLINSGSIDLHPWLSRRDALDSPDWAVIDLDPKGAPFGNVVKIARAVGRLLRGLGTEPYLKTSGSSGLHVFIPLVPGYTYAQSRMFCEAVARTIVLDHGDIATVQRVIGEREGKVYVDFLQNRREQTVVPPYVVRPVEAASVSMPLAWDELEEEFQVADFTLKTAPARIERLGDLFRTALGNPQDLGAAIAGLQKRMKERA